jgi:hypothetical protein
MNPINDLLAPRNPVIISGADSIQLNNMILENNSPFDTILITGVLNSTINSNHFVSTGSLAFIKILDANGLNIAKNVMIYESGPFAEFITFSGGTKVVIDSNVFKNLGTGNGSSLNIYNTIISNSMIKNNVEHGLLSQAKFNANAKIYSIGNHWNIGQDGGTGIFLLSNFNTTGVL